MIGGVADLVHKFFILPHKIKQNQVRGNIQ
jgi:hypothetical protein